MTYEAFHALLRTAETYKDIEEFLAAQEATQENEPLLRFSYIYAHAPSPTTVRKLLALTPERFAAMFSVPERTVESWDAGQSAPPRYVSDALAYAALTHLI